VYGLLVITPRYLYYFSSSLYWICRKCGYFSMLFSTVVGLGLGSDLVYGLLVITPRYLYYFSSSLSLSQSNHFYASK